MNIEETIFLSPGYGKWAMGRVMELHAGTDGYVRVTTVKTQTGVIKRPMVKLVPLPVDYLRNSGGLHKDQAEKYRNVLMEILKNPEDELAECLKAFVEANKEMGPSMLQCQI